MTGENTIPMTNSELSGMSTLDWLFTNYHDRRMLTWASYNSTHVRWGMNRVTVCLGRYEYVFIAPIDRQKDLAFIRRVNVDIAEAMAEFIRVLEL